MAALGLAAVAVLAMSQVRFAAGMAPGGEIEAAAAAAYGVYSASAATNGAVSNLSSAGDGSASQMLTFREATARVLEATHGWINCLLSARPRPPPEISRCTEAALPHVVDVLVAVSTAGWAIRFKSPDESEAVRKAIQHMSDVRTQVHGCVESLNPHLQVAGRCYTVL